MFSMQAILFISNSISLILICTVGKEAMHILFLINILLYPGQYGLLILILYFRLKSGFHGTTLELNRRSKFIFALFYIILFLFAISVYVIMFIMMMAYENSQSEQRKENKRPHSKGSDHEPIAMSETIETMMNICIISWFAAIFLFILLLCVLSVAFIYKLIRVNKQFKNNELMPTITKISLLSSVSIISFIILYGCALYLMMSRSIDEMFVAMGLKSLEVYTTFVCIFLSLQSSDDCYKKICGCCDGLCEKICIRCIDSKERKKQKEYGIDHERL